MTVRATVTKRTEMTSLEAYEIVLEALKAERDRRINSRLADSDLVEISKDYTTTRAALDFLWKSYIEEFDCG